MPPEGDQLYVYGVAPPVASIAALPFEPPKHETFVCDCMLVLNPEEFETETVAVEEQLFASVTVTV